MTRQRSDEPARLTCVEDGPYLAERVERLIGADGQLVATKPKMALCRCGQTARRPFCDGTHAKVGFRSAKLAGRVPDQRDDYAGNAITIHDNRGICSHAGYCSDNLSEVFRAGTEPWIDPDGAPAERIIEVVGRCPSGALSYSVDGVEHRDHERPAAVVVSPHGPLLIEGGVRLDGAESLEGTSTEHRTMCRCGKSKNKPFCDGSHWHANFRDDGRYRVAMLTELKEDEPVAAEAEGVALVLVRRGDEVVVLQGKCAHQGASLADGSVQGDKLVCGLHGWSYHLDSGANEDEARDRLHRFEASVDPRWGEVLVRLEEIRAFSSKKDVRAGTARDAGPSSGSNSREEPHNELIHELARDGLSKLGAHGPVAAMGVPRYQLPCWDDIQIVTAQLHRLPLLDDVAVGTELIIGPRAKRPLRLAIPLFVSDMSFGALSFEAKVALAKGAELSGTGICSGEGGMLPEEQAANSRYFYELASGRFGFAMELLDRVQAFHFKGGQGAKTGTGGHLPGNKVTGKIAAVRGLQPGQPAISPATFPDYHGIDDFRAFADRVREHTGGIPIGFKLSAQHIEADLDAALEVGVDYVILDGRGGATGAAPLIFRDNISVPTLPALARARRHLDAAGHHDITLIITGGLRTPADFTKALALGADGVAVSNAAIQAIGCVGARACHTNNCPAGIATQKEHLRRLIDVEQAAASLARFFDASVHLMSTLARACGHHHLSELCVDDLTTFKRDISYLTGVSYGGVTPL